MATQKKLNAYQLFVNEKVAELKALDEHKDKKYMEIRKLANEEWRKDHPVDPNKPPRKPRVKKVAGAVAVASANASTDESGGAAPAKKVRGAKAAEKAAKAEKKAEKAAKKAAKPVRAPSAYIQFISKILPEIKAENPTLKQKEIMSLAAKKWQIHKASV